MKVLKPENEIRKLIHTKFCIITEPNIIYTDVSAKEMRSGEFGWYMLTKTGIKIGSHHSIKKILKSKYI